MNIEGELTTTSLRIPLQQSHCIDHESRSHKILSINPSDHLLSSFQLAYARTFDSSGQQFGNKGLFPGWLTDINLTSEQVDSVTIYRLVYLRKQSSIL